MPRRLQFSSWDRLSDDGELGARDRRVGWQDDPIRNPTRRGDSVAILDMDNDRDHR